jgi:hypothetical protein
VKIGLDLLMTTATAATASAGEEVTAAKNHKVGSFSLMITYINHRSLKIIIFLFLLLLDN